MRNKKGAKVLQIHRELEIDNKPITADTIKDCFYGRAAKESTRLNWKPRTSSLILPLMDAASLRKPASVRP